MTATTHRTLCAVLVLATGAACEDRRWAPVAAAHVLTRELVRCLVAHKERVGRYPEALATLKETIALGGDACAHLDADFMSRAQVNYAGYQWHYEAKSGGVGFELTTHPVSEYPHRCSFDTSERLVLNRTCADVDGSESEEVDVAGGSRE